MKNEVESLLELAQKANFEEDDIYEYIEKEKKLPMYKKVHVKKTQRNLAGAKVPLLDSIYDEWIQHTYIGNPDEYE